MKSILSFISFSIILCACKFYGLTSDYQTLNEAQRKMIVDYHSYDNMTFGYIYKIDGKKLKAEIENRDKVLVYLFTNYCSSDECKPLRVYKEYADRNKYTLFLVMTGYYRLHEILEQKFEEPILSIDYESYDSEKSKDVIRYFTNEIQGHPKDKEKGEYLGSLYFFENGQLAKNVRELPTEN